MVPAAAAARALRVSLNLTRHNSLLGRWVRDYCLPHFDIAGDITFENNVTPS
jgi:hypothetical protein